MIIAPSSNCNVHLHHLHSSFSVADICFFLFSRESLLPHDRQRWKYHNKKMPAKQTMFTGWTSSAYHNIKNMWAGDQHDLFCCGGEGEKPCDRRYAFFFFPRIIHLRLLLCFVGSSNPPENQHESAAFLDDQKNNECREERENKVISADKIGCFTGVFHFASFGNVLESWDFEYSWTCTKMHSCERNYHLSSPGFFSLCSAHKEKKALEMVCWIVLHAWMSLLTYFFISTFSLQFHRLFGTFFFQGDVSWKYHCTMTPIPELHFYLLDSHAMTFPFDSTNNNHDNNNMYPFFHVIRSMLRISLGDCWWWYFPGKTKNKSCDI